MAYQVRYPVVGKTKKKRRLRRGVLTGVAFFLFVQLVHHCWPEGWQTIRQVFVPEENVRAVAAFVEQVKAGTPASEAVTAFCRSLMEDICEGIR